MADVNDFVPYFLDECREGLASVETDMVELEHDSAPTARLDRIFRTLHTIKGNCGFLGFERLGALAHAGETLLSRLRDRKVALSSEVTDHLLQLIDGVRSFLNEIAEKFSEGTVDFSALCESLLQLADAESAKVPDVTSPQLSAAKNPEKITSAPESASQQWERTLVATPAAGGDRKEIAEPPRSKSDAINRPPSGRVPASGAKVASNMEAKQESQQHRLAADPDFSFEKQFPSSDSSLISTELSQTSIRMDVGLLDRLMNLIGELVLNRNQMLQYISLLSDPTMSLMAQRLNTITSELQEGFMRTRMLRIGTMWKRFPRVIRDTAQQCGKQVRLVTEGDTTELDRSLIEAITDPLTHTIRNAIDHGIESPQVRRSRGKPEHGTVTLRAYHEGGQVHIDISDDGAGVDIEKVRAKAKMVGLFSAEESAVLTEAQLLSSIFMPGFSTKENVSSLSGRGVGMDVVKTRIEHAGGTVQISSVSGSGTTVHMTVPLTLAIIPALIVRNANQQFAVPQVSLNELLRLTADEVQQRIEVIEDSATLRLRGRLLPLVRLSEVLRDTSVQQSAADETCVLVLRSADRTFGLIVDAVTNNEEIVVKPLLPLLQGLSVYSGSTLLGDGSLALILDVLGLARQSGVFSRATSAADIDVSSSRDSVLVDLSSGLLLCGVGLERRVAFPVSSVRRLEEIPKESVQQAGLCTVVPYRDDLLPLVDIAALLYSEATPASAQEMEKWPIVVCTTESGEMGFRVNQVLDIAVAPLRILPAPLSGLLGSAIIDGHITDLIDMSQISRPTAASTGTHPHGRNSTTL